MAAPHATRSTELRHVEVEQGEEDVRHSRVRVRQRLRAAQRCSINDQREKCQFETDRDKSTPAVSKSKKKERLAGMSRRSKRIALHVILIGLMLALPFIAQHFRLLSAPPLLAPGIK
jgi:hypothetical protein